MKLSGRFGRFGGTYVPEILMPALEQLEAAFLDSRSDAAFQRELNDLLVHYAGRPTPLYRCRNLPVNGPAQIYLKREDLLHGGAHKTNQALGRDCWPRDGKAPSHRGDRRGSARRRHGADRAVLGLKTRIYMGAVDMERQKTECVPHAPHGRGGGTGHHRLRTLKDAINEALRDWSSSYEDTHYLLGTVAGPHPFPTMVRDFPAHHRGRGAGADPARHR
jgi:tryptophan synthase beta chain